MSCQLKRCSVSEPARRAGLLIHCSTRASDALDCLICAFDCTEADALLARAKIRYIPASPSK